MRVLLTGASGFLGSHIADRLAREDVTLRLLLRRTSSLDFLQDVAGKYERAVGDLRDPASLAAALADVDCVIACGGLTWARTEAEYQAVNAHGTQLLVQASIAAGVTRFVYISSVAAQGPSPDGKPHLERAAPVSPYGRSKRDGELVTLASRDAISVAVVRPTIVYGPRDVNLLPVYRVVRWLRMAPVYGDGTNVLTWIHAYDCADAIVRVALSKTPPGAVYSVSDGRFYDWRDVARAYGRALNRRPLIVKVPPWLYHAAGHLGSSFSSLTGIEVPIDRQVTSEMRQRYWVCDNEAITRDLGWEPTLDLEDGVAQTVAWYREHGWN